MAQVEDHRLMPPPAPRPPAAAAPAKPRLIVLEEEEYSSKLEEIIERDFFPDVPKMHNQLEWLQAVNSGDPLAMRKAQLNIAHRRAGFKTPLAPGIGAPPAATPGTWTTPATSLHRTPAMTPLGAAAFTPFYALGGHAGCAPDLSSATPSATPSRQHAPGSQPPAGVSSGGGGGRAEPRAPPLSLDGFLSRYTSEDNAAFSAIAAAEAARKRAKLSHYFEGQAVPQHLLKERADDGYGSTGQQPMTLQPVPHVPLNALYYAVPGRALSEAELAACAAGAPKQVVPRNTRFEVDDGGGGGAADGAAAAAVAAALAGNCSEHSQQQQRAAPAPSGGMPVAPAQHGGVAPPAYLATPSMTPGVGASPLMTWGDIESTPLRLEMEEGLTLDTDPLGPAYNVAQPSQRETVARALAAKSAAYPSAARLAAARTPGALHRRPATPAGGGAAPLSVAAQKLASSLLRQNSVLRGAAGAGGLGGAGRSAVVGLDSALRASYGGTQGAAGRLGLSPAAVRAGSLSARGTPALGTHDRDPGSSIAVKAGGTRGWTGSGAGGSSWVTPLVETSGSKRRQSAPAAPAASGCGEQLRLGAGQSVTDDLLDL